MNDQLLSIRTPLIIIGVGILLAFLAPLILTGYFFNTGVDFSSTGQIGDTIGGLTAPIFSLVGSVLIYYSFYAQMQANRVQIRQLVETRSRGNFDLILGLIGQLKDDINSFRVQAHTATVYIDGIEAMSRFADELYNRTKNQVDAKKNATITMDKNQAAHMLFVVSNCEFIYQMLDSYELSDTEHNMLIDHLNILRDSKLREPLTRIISARQLTVPGIDFDEKLEMVVEKSASILKL